MIKEIIVGEGERIIVNSSEKRDIVFEIVVRAAEKSEDKFQIINKIADMPINKRPFHADFKRYFNEFWPIRGQGKMPSEVTGITIHHTMSHSPLATAQYCTNVKGYPTTQYHYWVSANDNVDVYQLLKEEWAIWHDHTGTYQTNLSVGMAGHLHNHKPPKDQIKACAMLCKHLMKKHNLTIENVVGHRDQYSKTACPGWDSAHWKNDFYNALQRVSIK